MTTPSPDPLPRAADWEAFYRDYRKPGYVPGFEITTKLGGGMFGLVYRARRLSIGKDYAIKFLQVEDGEVRRAVVSELEQVKWFAQIDHPNLVSIEDRGEVDGIPYLVMAFAGTETLRDKLPGRVPEPAAKEDLVRWFLQACRGLGALHERSLVHFDVKPANVFLKGGVARLGDYGLSKLVTHSRGSLSMGRGTPYYMAPELLQRRGDHRSDVYSAGVMLYEILCGRVPFTGDSEWEVLRQHETRPPDLPGHLSARERAVLQRCLQKDPAERFQGVHDLIAALGAPPSAGAAAFTEAPAGGQPTAPLAPPPLPGAVPATDPPPAATSEDPYAGLGKASREAFRHANTIAQQAYQQANRIARDAADKARKLMQQAVDKSRHGGLRRALALRRLRRMHRDADGRARVAAVAEAVASPAVRRRSPALRLLLVTAAVLLVPAALLLPWTMGGPRPSGIAVAIPAPVAPRAASVAGADGSARRATFRVFDVPSGFEGLVALGEPPWVDLADVDPVRARAALLQHIDRLRATAPLSPVARATAPRLPRFERAGGDEAREQRVRAEVLALLQGRTYSQSRARALAEQAPLSLVVAAEELRALDWQRTGTLERARRLHRLLEETTGCRDLPLVDDPAATPARLADANRALGELWLWFVNEFAHTPRAWATFKRLMPPG